MLTKLRCSDVELKEVMDVARDSEGKEFRTTSYYSKNYKVLFISSSFDSIL